MLLNDGRSISQNVASLNVLIHDVIKLLYHKILVLIEMILCYKTVCLK